MVYHKVDTRTNTLILRAKERVRNDLLLIDAELTTCSRFVLVFDLKVDSLVGRGKLADVKRLPRTGKANG
jgi:hypothetical protein